MLFGSILTAVAVTGMMLWSLLEVRRVDRVIDEVDARIADREASGQAAEEAGEADATDAGQEGAREPAEGETMEADPEGPREPAEGDTKGAAQGAVDPAEADTGSRGADG